MAEPSIFEQIKANITSEGKLPRDFSIEKSNEPNELRFMPGAKDGVGIFHYGASKPDDLAKDIVNLLNTEWEKSKGTSPQIISEWLQKYGTVSVADPILEIIRTNRKEYSLQHIADHAWHFAMETSDEELVKLGIVLLGLVDLSHENANDILERLLILASYEEFTLYVAVAVSRMKSGNDLLFKMAQKVDGWGKIHVVERLEPTTDEIKEWILREGCSNTVMDAYLGLTCAEKGDLISALRLDFLDGELYGKIAIVVDALLDEGPVPGISEYEHADEAMRLFMNHAKQHVKDLKDLWHILNIQMWAEDSETGDRSEVLSLCAEIIGRPCWKDMIFDTITSETDDSKLFYASNVASRMEIDISDELFSLIKSDPIKYHTYIQRLFKNPKIVDELINIYEAILPLDEMADGMGDYVFADKYKQEYHCLDFILPELAAYPMQGIPLIKTGLNCRVVRSRNMACRALSGWIKELSGKPLDAISEELYAEVKQICEIEVNDKTKETMMNLLNGVIEEEQ